MIQVFFYRNDYIFRFADCKKNNTIGSFLSQAECQYENAYLHGQKLKKEEFLDKYADQLHYNAIFLSITRNQRFKYQEIKPNLDNYQIDENIQKSPLGFKSIDTTTQKEVFLKVFNSDFVESELNNIYISRYLDLPGVIQIIGYYFQVDPTQKIISDLHLQNTDNINIVISEYIENGTVEANNNEYLKSNGSKNEKVTPTVRSKIIFGVASIMKQIHENGCVHRMLTTDTVFLDDKLEPKIGCFNFAHFTDQIRTELSSSSTCISPELLNNELINNPEAIDVFSYAFFLYKMFTFERIRFNDNRPINVEMQFMAKIGRGERPRKMEFIPDHYWELIEACWSQFPSERPTFAEIVDILKDDKFALNEFGMKTDLEKLHEYQKRVESNKSKKIIEEDEDKSTSSEEENFEEEDEDIDDNYIVDLSNYSIVLKVAETSLGDAYKVESNETGDFYLAIVSDTEVDFKRSKIYREAKILSKLNHPCISKFIGISPTDFEHENRPVILIEFSSNGNLKQLLDTERNINPIDDWNETKKLINIYGIASCLSYLNSVNIIYKDLNPENIVLDDFLCPKLINFSFADIPKQMSRIVEEEEFKGTPKYAAPELFDNEKFNQSTVVYSFALILYELISGKKIFEGKTVFQIMKDVSEGFRPELDETFSTVYRDLIGLCWLEAAPNRPSFDQIINMLVYNQKSIDGVNHDEFNAYMNFIDDSQAFYEKNKEVLQINEYIKSFKKVDLSSIRQEYLKNKKKRIKLNCKYIDLDDYNQDKKIGEGNFGVIYKISEKKNDENSFAAKISKNSLQDIEEDELISHYREVSIISQLNHSCILKFIGYSSTDFNKDDNPVIVTELSRKGSLLNVINLERDSLALSEWDKTTKLINIYGIASGMSYLHHYNIIHRDLKPDNILLNDNLYPKLADFGLSKEISEDNLNVPNPDYKIKGTPMYCSPEILESYNYTKAGDVYAFGLIVYEIITNEVPFNDIKNIFKLTSEVVINKKRPRFTYPVPDCYRELIEKCWSHDHKCRPSFDEIVNDLRNNRDFLEDIDEDVFFDYVYEIDGYNKQYQNQEEEDYFKNVLHEFEIKKSSEPIRREKVIEDQNENDLRKVEETENNNNEEDEEENLKEDNNEKVKENTKKIKSDGSGGCCNIV